MIIRDTEPERDAAACAEIYAWYVTDTIVSFEYEPPSVAEMARRMRAAHAWLVAEEADVIAGYAYTSPHRERAGYRWAADIAVYVRVDRQRSGLGRALYSNLVERARQSGFRTLCAGVTQPNQASNGLHEAMGFDEVGTYRRIGWKEGTWHDVRWYQLQLWPGDASPPDQEERLATA